MKEHEEYFGEKADDVSIGTDSSSRSAVEETTLENEDVIGDQTDFDNENDISTGYCPNEDSINMLREIVQKLKVIDVKDFKDNHKLHMILEMLEEKTWLDQASEVMPIMVSILAQ